MPEIHGAVEGVGVLAEQPGHGDVHPSVYPRDRGQVEACDGDISICIGQQRGGREGVLVDVNEG